MSKWDQRYLRLAKIVASWSKDPSTKCGAVIVRQDMTLSSVGFNGFARGLDDDMKDYLDRDKKYPAILHSEWNAISSSKEKKLNNHIVYAYPMPPCDECTAALLQKNIQRIVTHPPNLDQLTRWQNMFEDAQDMCYQKSVQIEYQNLEQDVNEVVFQTENKWDNRFLNVAHEVSTWSKDSLHAQGAVLVRPDKTIASLGFNGYPQKVKDDPLLKNEKYSRGKRLIPAELNAILFASDESLEGMTLFTYPSPPSLRVLHHMIQEKISRIVCPLREYDMDIIKTAQKAHIELVFLDEILQKDKDQNMNNEANIKEIHHKNDVRDVKIEVENNKNVAKLKFK